MPRYYPLKDLDKSVREHIVDGLLRIRYDMKEIYKVPPRTARDTLLLATWNIRDFGKGKSGARLPEALFFMAEIISHFDLVAVQEVFENMYEFEKLHYYLGPNWDYIATDVTEGAGGNGERMVFLYDKRKVSFRNIAGEIVLPKGKKIFDQMQFARTPFSVAFQSGWFSFHLCTVHIFYGEDSGEKFKQRVKEIDAIGEFIAGRARSENSNYILLGDFNIRTPDDDTMQALKKHKFEMPEVLQLFTNVRLDKYYDQIAFKTQKDELQLGPSDPPAGAVNFFQMVYRGKSNDEGSDWKYYFDRITGLAKPNPKHSKTEEAIQKKYASALKTWSTKKSGNTRVARTDEEKAKYFETWRTYQMSDHLPLWVELRIDFSERYLKKIRKM